MKTKKWIQFWFFLILLIPLIILFNYVIDPYGFNQKTLIKGNNNPLSACAAIIAGMGLKPARPKLTPEIKTKPQTIRKFLELTAHRSGCLLSPKSPCAVSAEAKGAVISDEKPAANIPNPKT